MSQEEALRILETEWAEDKAIWKQALTDGHSATEVLSILESFA